MKKTIKVYLKGKDVSCVGQYNSGNNTLTILAGSLIRKKVSPNFKYNRKRLSQIREYCKEQGDSYFLVKDAVFDTPSAAAKFSLGYEVNGPAYWRTDDNVNLKVIMQKQKSNVEHNIESE